MKRPILKVLSLLLLLPTLLISTCAHADSKASFKIAWSIYAGWMPWDYAASSGIMKKWADKYGIKVDIVQINDYVESINQYTAGEFDGCVMTNMDAVWNNACEVNSRYTLFHFIFAVIILKFMMQNWQFASGCLL